MKKKILSLCVVMALAVTAIIGGTLAYFSDTDAQTNTFTTGNVEIDLWEDFGTNTGSEELIPAVDEDVDYIEKEVYVTNTGSEDAYVRVHIAVPAVLEETGRFDAVDGVLHFDFANAEEGKWDWSDAADGDDYEAKTNKYETTIDGKEYNVYVVTYTSALETNDATEDAISKVWMDAETTNEDITTIKAVLGDSWYIYVAAEGTQAAGFGDAYAALNEAFGDPTDAAYTATVDWTAVTDGKTFENKD